jgi:hypothetical protein
MKWKFKLYKDGQTFSVETPEGVADYQTALSFFTYLEPYTVVSQETSHDTGNNKGFFSFW